MTEVYALIENDEDDDSMKDNVFFRPLPNDMHNYDSEDEMDASSSLFTITASPIRCKFGHYGEVVGAYVNSTAIKCVTPSSPYAPETVPSETISFTLTMNGYDFSSEDDSDLQFTFEGSGSNFGLGPIFLFIMMVAVLIGAFIYFTQNAAMF